MPSAPLLFFHFPQPEKEYNPRNLVAVGISETNKSKTAASV
jgi:hypothetical protein